MSKSTWKGADTLKNPFKMTDCVTPSVHFTPVICISNDHAQIALSAWKYQVARRVVTCVQWHKLAYKLHHVLLFSSFVSVQLLLTGPGDDMFDQSMHCL